MLNKRFAGALIGLIGGGILTIIVTGFAVTLLDLQFGSVLPITVVGALFFAFLGALYPKIAEILIEFIG